MSAYLLDTHVLLWLMDGSPELSASTTMRLQAASAHGKLGVSVMSAWEISMLVRKQRIVLEMPVRDWMRKVQAHPSLQVAPLSVEIAMESNELPNGMHGDPVDRILVATARIAGTTLVTRDQGILDYARKGHVTILEA